MAHTWGCVPFSTHLILGATVASEYTTLTDAQKDIYKMIISCGFIDTHPGNPVIDKIFTMFPSGTQTKTNIEALLTYTPPGP